ncbi:flagellar biosynthesis protein FlhB [Paracoccaceae bacterium GXU_MW_L88]
MSEGQSDSGEKVFDPTPQRLDRARREGDIPQSKDLNAAAVYLAIFIASIGFGGYVMREAAGPMQFALGNADYFAPQFLGSGGPAMAGEWFLAMLTPLLLILLLPAGFGLISLIAQRAIVFAPSKLKPKLSRISLISNAKNKFGTAGLVEFAKSALKMGLIGLGLAIYLKRNQDMIIGAARAESPQVVAMMAQIITSMLTITLLIAIFIGGIDYFWQQYHHRQKLRMSLQEMKDEMKNVEGDPHMKAQRRKRGEELAMNQMLADVPKADVILVNPTHYAVALTWTRLPGSAPKLIAKGVDDVAARIRDIAREANIPIHSDPPTARALNASTEIGDEIHPDHYRPVAAAIRFADTMRKKMRERGYS